MSVTRIPAVLWDTVQARAAGSCEYCGIHEDDAFEAHEADHIIAEQHGGATTAENLAFACWQCNRRKGPNLPQLTRKPVKSSGSSTRASTIGAIISVWRARGFSRTQRLAAQPFRFYGSIPQRTLSCGRLSERLAVTQHVERGSPARSLLIARRFSHAPGALATFRQSRACPAQASAWHWSSGQPNPSAALFLFPGAATPLAEY